MNDNEFNSLKDGQLGEFIGIFAGDGYSFVDKDYHYSIRLFFNIKEEEYIAYVKSLLTLLFNKKPFQYSRKQYNITVLKYNSKRIFNLINNFLTWNREGNGSKSRTVKLKPRYHSEDFSTGFIRGCIDTDGYINSNKIEFDSASKKLSINIQNFLKRLQINFTSHQRNDKRKNRVPMHMININKTNRCRFIQLIKPKKCVGRDSNPD